MYNPYYPQYMQQYQMDQQQYRPQIQQPQVAGTQMSLPQDERIWVQGESSAQAYLVAPNSFVRLWDSTRPVFYEKRADATGKPSIIAYEYHSNDQQENTEETTNNYDEQMKRINDRLNEIEERMNYYEQTESYDDDTTVSAVPERVQRKSAAGTRKTGQRG